MKRILLATAVSLLFLAWAVLPVGCANIVPPSGGPRDSLPPQLVSAVPGDSTLNFRWGTNLATWNIVAVGATSSGPDANGVVVTVTEDGGSSADYDLIQIQLPKTNAVGGKLFGQLQGSQP